VLSGRVDSEVAANAATNRHDFLVALEQAVKRRRAEDAAAAAATTTQPEPALPPEPPVPHVTPHEAVAAPTIAPVQQDEGLGLRLATPS
jgi:hypothetical protein